MFLLVFSVSGFRDTSTFTSRDNSTWQSTDDYLNNASTLPMNASLSTYTGNGTVVTESTTSTKPDYSQENGYNVYYERPKSSMLLETNLDEPSPHPPRSKSADILETNFDYMLPPHQPAKRNLTTTFQPAPRSKSQPLETAM